MKKQNLKQLAEQGVELLLVPKYKAKSNNVISSEGFVYSLAEYNLKDNTAIIFSFNGLGGIDEYLIALDELYLWDKPEN